MAFTFFFRDQKPLEHAVHFLKSAAAGRARVRIWDAGCAMGQEPYTLAILLAENMGQFAFRNIQIFASDYDAPLLKIVKEGAYPKEELQRIPGEFFEKYFEKNGREGWFRIADLIKDRVTACHHDLLTLTPVQTGFSLIICKNVLLHFSYEQRIQVIKMFHAALEPQGILAMEHTQKMPEELALHFEQLVGDAQVYRKREVAA
jgi:chemotaxis protein methyltransferase CheR